jgi:omega-6 fatty acid desaturase (delta-12 desaturase)
MIWSAEHAYWLTLLLSIPLGGLVVRFFIIQHDCGHGSFTPSRRVNDTIGRIVSVLTVTPYGLWRRTHAQHHASSGNLDRRGAGDIKTLTVAEYMALTSGEKFRYRIYRSPIFLFLVGVPAFFVLIQRLPWFHPLPAREVWRSVIGLNLALVVLYGALGYAMGFGKLAMIAIPSIFVATIIGGWLFFIQHQFEDTHWDTSENWNFQVAAVHGSSFYVLHPILDWFTGNIGLHHIHHLNSMVPNYRLRACLEASPEFMSLNRLTLWDSFQCARLTLWDESQRRLIGFSDLKTMPSAT